MMSSCILPRFHSFTTIHSNSLNRYQQSILHPSPNHKPKPSARRLGAINCLPIHHITKSPEGLSSNMGRCVIQLVTGPAGSGKSTYCHIMQEHGLALGPKHKRRIHIANLDPAAEHFRYTLAFDIRDLISVEDVMDELHLGPNGGLVYCMEYLLQNMDWLQENLDEYDDDEYLILDCPGQIELYTHIPVMNKIIDQLRLWGYNDKLVSVFIVDATFVTDPAKFISGSLLALSAMISMQLPHVNVLSKCDLVEEGSMERVLEMESALQLWDVLGDHGRNRREGDGDDADGASMFSFLREESPYQHFQPPLNDSSDTAVATTTSSSAESNTLKQNARNREKKWNRLTEAICSLLDDYSMVGFIPLNIDNEDSIAHVLATVDHAIQYGEDLEVRGADYDDDLSGDYGDGDEED